jgi:DNA-binding response OmpR family regulator
MRLLLIEDDAALRLGLARRLEADGYRVDHAADGSFAPIETLRGRGYRFTPE